MNTVKLMQFHKCQENDREILKSAWGDSQNFLQNDINFLHLIRTLLIVKWLIYLM